VYAIRTNDVCMQHDWRRVKNGIQLVGCTNHYDSSNLVDAINFLLKSVEANGMPRPARL
jgi:hypothetical protein